MGIAFFVSGAAGLVYQVAWQRILALHSGVGIYSVAIIVAAFMAGLGLGSHLGGRLSVRLAPRRALVAFAALELGIGTFGAGSCALYYDLVYERAASLYSSHWHAAALHVAALILPTALMGMTLPILVRATVRDVPSAGGTVGLLYAVNILGAGAGALLTPWVLIRSFGIRGAVAAAALANATAGLTALGVAAARWRREEAGEGPIEAPAGPSRQERGSFGLWTALYALSGFCALSLEILWFRLLDVAVKSTAFTFGTLLAFYLLGSGLGCLAGIPLARRLRRPLRAFLLCQCLLLVYAGVSALALVSLPPDLPVYGWFARYWDGPREFSLGSDWDLPFLLRLYVLLPAALFGPATLLMGLSFPALQRAVHDDAITSGRKVGMLQAANIAGCVAGSLGVGLVSLTALGTAGSLRLLLLGGVIFAFVGILKEGGGVKWAALTLALLILAAAFPDTGSFWRRLHGPSQLAGFFEEDASGVGGMVKRDADQWIVFVNGRTHSGVPFGGIHSRLGAAPALIHPAPRDVAIIGLGSGDTAWAAGCRPETSSITVFEILGSQPHLMQRLDEREEFSTLRSFLADPRLRIRIADGRNALKQQEARYDLIEADALRPDVAYAGNLYSVEFFRECARRLKPDGIMCTWAPTARVLVSFSHVFPHVIRHRSGLMLIGSSRPVRVDPASWLTRLESPAVRTYLGARIVDDATRLLEEFEKLPRRRHSPPERLNLDLFPRDEFQVALKNR